MCREFDYLSSLLMILEKCKPLRQLLPCLSSVYAAGYPGQPVASSSKLWGALVVKVVWQVAGNVDNFQLRLFVCLTVCLSVLTGLCLSSWQTNKNEEVAAAQDPSSVLLVGAMQSYCTCCTVALLLMSMHLLSTHTHSLTRSHAQLTHCLAITSDRQ